MPTQTFQIEQSSSLVVVTLNQPRLTGQDMQDLVAELIQKMRNDGALFFVLDMSSVNLVDSACIGSLVMFLQDLEHVRGRVALASCRPSVCYLFKITRLDAVFHLYDELDDAKASIVSG